MKLVGYDDMGAGLICQQIFTPRPHLVSTMRGRVWLFYNLADDALRLLRLVVHRPSEWEDYSVVCEKVTVVSVTNSSHFIT